MSDVISRSNNQQNLGDTPIGNAVQMRERMRSLIRDEIDKLNPTDDARRALELIIESSLRPSSADGELKLTVIDPQGQPRMLEKNGQQVPFSLQDLIAELRRIHPVLFKSPSRQQPAADEAASRLAYPVTAPARQKTERDWLKLDSGEESAPESRPTPAPAADTLGQWRKGKIRFHGWSKRLSGKLQTSRILNSTATRIDARKGVAASIDDSKQRAQAFFDNLQEQPVSRRPGFALGLVAATLLLGAGTYFFLQSGDATQASIDEPTETGALAPGQAANAHSPVVRSSSGRSLRGVPDVIDTATLSLNGEVVRLFGVEWAPGAGKPEDLTAYLQGREVSCDPAGGDDTYRCRVGEQDLSRVILFNGGGQPTSAATPELKAAADHAREAKLGVWSKQP